VGLSVGDVSGGHFLLDLLYRDGILHLELFVGRYGILRGPIPDITNGTVYATDYTNLRNALFQLARMLKQDHDQLRAMGILT